MWSTGILHWTELCFSLSSIRTRLTTWFAATEAPGVATWSLQSPTSCERDVSSSRYRTLLNLLYTVYNIFIFLCITSTVSIRLEYLGFNPMLINCRWKQFWTEATRKRSWRRGNCIAIIQFLPYYCHFSIVYCLVSCDLKKVQLHQFIFYQL